MTKKPSPDNMSGYRYYQARNGGIYITTPNGSFCTQLSKGQIQDLFLSLFDLADFDYDLYCQHYNIEEKKT